MLKTIADLGLVGFPNAGKSTLTNLITAARPKTAPYPFTTLHVNVGVIEYPDRHDRVVMADIPGLIKGAHENRGLGHQFLRHIERCSLLVFLIDMAGNDGRRPWDDFKVLERELRLYSPVLASKPRIVVANKMDLPSAVKNLQEFTRKVAAPTLAISCHDGSGLEVFKEAVWKAVRQGVLLVSASKPSKGKAEPKRTKRVQRAVKLVTKAVRKPKKKVSRPAGRKPVKRSKTPRRRGRRGVTSPS